MYNFETVGEKERAGDKNNWVGGEWSCTEREGGRPYEINTIHFPYWSVRAVQMAHECVRASETTYVFEDECVCVCVDCMADLGQRWLRLIECSLV